MSINFDRAADYYDQSRGYAPATAASVARGLASAVAARPETRFLEIGVGTGRVALPLAGLGYSVTGVDISHAMLERLRSKLEDLARAGRSVPLHVAVADMQALPYADCTFDAVIATHVLHLVADPRLAVTEAFRVLQPAGSLLICGDDHRARSEGSVIEQWRVILERHGLAAPTATDAAGEVVRSLLADDPGLALEETRPASWHAETTPAAELDSVRRRLWSDTWRLNDGQFELCLVELTQWFEDHFSGREQARSVSGVEFVVRRLYRPSAAG
jgi:SAM-dependent methyltransferase